MKHYLYFLPILLLACSKSQNKQPEQELSKAVVTTIENNNETCWQGTLNNKIPVFIHYQIDNNVVIGEITYLNTKDKLPITLLGTIEEDNQYRLLEFDPKGFITGVIEGKPDGKTFNGNWFSTKNDKEYALKLSTSDTLISKPDIKATSDELFGDYHYQYGETGFNGDFKITKISNDEIAFDILSLTNVERGPNIAEVEKDTIHMTDDSFIYNIPDSDDCEFRVSFYKNFLYIRYTKGYCAGQFGLNATVDGIYLKIQ